MLEGLYTIVIRISGNKDPMNDDDATLEIGYSPDQIMKDARGNVGIDYSYRILKSEQYTKLKARIIELGSAALGASPEEVDFEGGVVMVRGDASRALPLAHLAAMASSLDDDASSATLQGDSAKMRAVAAPMSKRRRGVGAVHRHVPAR